MAARESLLAAGRVIGDAKSFRFIGSPDDAGRLLARQALSIKPFQQRGRKVAVEIGAPWSGTDPSHTGGGWRQRDNTASVDTDRKANLAATVGDKDSMGNDGKPGLVRWNRRNQCLAPMKESADVEHHVATLYTSLELSRSTWLVTSLSPGSVTFIPAQLIGAAFGTVVAWALFRATMASKGN
jgi:hypothetical protein